MTGRVSRKRQTSASRRRCISSIRSLRADGVNVSVFRQTNAGGTWTDASVDPATEEQLENAILQRARALKASEAG